MRRQSKLLYSINPFLSPACAVLLSSIRKPNNSISIYLTFGFPGARIRGSLNPQIKKYIIWHKNSTGDIHATSKLIFTGQERLINRFQGNIDSYLDNHVFN